MNDYLQRKISRMVSALRGLTPEVNRIDVRMEEIAGPSISPRTFFVNVRLAGDEIIAKDSGRHWKSLIKHVGQRLNRQLKKRSSLLRRKMLTGVASPARA
jgi:hypothetical protein